MSIRIDSRGAMPAVDLPLVLGVVGNFSGNNQTPKDSWATRTFEYVDPDNFEQRLQECQPQLDLEVSDMFTQDDMKFRVCLAFKGLKDFSPDRLVEQIPMLSKLMEIRHELMNQKSPPVRQSSKSIEGPTPPPMARTTGDFNDGNVSLLDQVIGATNFEDRKLGDGEQTVEEKVRDRRAEHWLENWIQQALDGQELIDENWKAWVDATVGDIDQKISVQLAAIMHHPDFQALEGAWRGLSFLMKNMEHGSQIRLQMIHCSRTELLSDLKNRDYRDTALYQKIHASRFEERDGPPFGAVLMDFAFSWTDDDLELLSSIGQIGENACCPIFADVSSEVFGVSSWSRFMPCYRPELFQQAEMHEGWSKLRREPSSKFLTLMAPRMLARLPYGAKTRPCEKFAFEELGLGESTMSEADWSSDLCWMSSIYSLGIVLARAFARHRWCIAIRGSRDGFVENIPTLVVPSVSGSVLQFGPVECRFDDRAEWSLVQSGLLPWLTNIDSEFTVMMTCPSVHLPTTTVEKKVDPDEMTASRLGFQMVVSRVCQFLRIIVRDLTKEWAYPADVERILNGWLSNRVSSNPEVGDEPLSSPLVSAVVSVQVRPGAPGKINAVLQIQPWLQMDQLSNPVTIRFELN